MEPRRLAMVDTLYAAALDSSWLNEVREEQEMPKSKEEVQKFIEALEDAGYEPKSYSGRGMFGKNCVSLRSNGDEEEKFSAWDVAKSLWYGCEAEDAIDIPEPRQDQLGLGIVLYWPSYEWPKESV